jgi:drug/metabolite transporter (DMT)-like permease
MNPVPAAAIPAVAHHRAGLALAAAAAILLSGKVIFVKLLYAHGLDAVDVITLRMLTAGPLFVAVAWWTWDQSPRPSRSDLLRVAGLGFMGYYASSMMDLIGLQYVSAGLERLILFLTPSFVLLLGLILLKRRVRPLQWVSLGIAYAGIVLVFWHEIGTFERPNIALGAVLIALSAVMYAVYLLVSEGLMRRLGMLRMVALAMCASTLFCLIQYPVLRPLTALADFPATVWWLSLANGTVCTALPIFMTMAAVRDIGAGPASQAGMIGPASTLLLAAWLLGEPITLVQLAGTALVTGGILLLSSRRAAPVQNPLVD